MSMGQSVKGRGVATGLAMAAVLAGTGAAAQAAPDLTGTRLSVSADGVVTRVPDQVTVSAGVTSVAGSAEAALAANRTAMTAVVDRLRRAGVADRDIQTNQITLNPQMSEDGGKPPVVTGYAARNAVTVRFREVNRAGAILDALVAAGATDIDGPDFGYADPDAGLDEARARAVAAARARAEVYAKAAGLHVRRIVSIDEQGVSSPGPVPMRPMMLRMAKTPILAGEGERRVTVAVTFELE